MPFYAIILEVRSSAPGISRNRFAAMSDHACTVRKRVCRTTSAPVSTTRTPSLPQDPVTRRTRANISTVIRLTSQWIRPVGITPCVHTRVFGFFTIILYTISVSSSSLSLLGVYTFRSSDRLVGPTGLSDLSVRRSYRVNASSDQSDRRSEESNMFDFVRLSKRVDTTSDWSDRLASRTTNHAAARRYYN